MDIVELDNLTALDRKILSENNLYSAKLIAQVGVEYLRGLGISDPLAVLSEANTIARHMEMEQYHQRLGKSVMDRREKPLNVFAKRRSVEEMLDGDENDMQAKKEETPGLVKRYKNGGLAEVSFGSLGFCLLDFVVCKVMIDLVEDEDKPRAVRSLEILSSEEEHEEHEEQEEQEEQEDVHMAKRDAGFQKLLKRSAFHPREASAG